MDADGRIELRVPIRQSNAGFQIWRAATGPDRDHVLDARVQRARHHLVTIGIELRTVEMAVGVD
jgi:hypothetical protein